MIESINIGGAHGEPQHGVEEARLVAGKGIVGDRNFGEDRWPGQNITFIEAEEIESFNTTFKQAVQASDTGRNVLTRSIGLNELVGKHFWIGEVQLYGVELCEPCMTFGTRLSAPGLSAPQVVRAWVHKAGLRARILVPRAQGVTRVLDHPRTCRRIRRDHRVTPQRSNRPLAPRSKRPASTMSTASWRAIRSALPARCTPISPSGACWGKPRMNASACAEWARKNWSS